MSELLVQVHLRSGTTQLTCWVNEHVTAGDRITLKNDEVPDREWDVTWVSSQGLPPQRGWHVGGL